MRKQRQLFTKKYYLPLFITQLTGAFNDSFFKQAIILLLSYGNWVAAKQSIYWINAVSLLFILPFFLFSALGGELADKYQKSTIIRYTKAFEVLLIAFAAYALWQKHLNDLLIITFFFGLHSSLFGPAKYAILPELLQTDELLAGNALIESSTFIMILIGLLGSYVITHGQYGINMTILILTFTAIIGFIASLCIPQTKQTHQNIHINLNLFSSTYQIIQDAIQNRIIWRAILGISWFWLLGYIMLMQLPVFIRDHLHAGSIVVSFCLGLFTIGFLVGALICNQLLKSRVETTYATPATFGISIFLFDLYFRMNSLDLSKMNQWINLGLGFDLLMIAFCGGLLTVPLYALLQTTSTEVKRSRTIAANNVINAFFMMFGSMLVYIFNHFDWQISTLLLYLGLFNFIITVLISGLMSRNLIKSILKSILRWCYQVEVYGIEHYPNRDDNYIVIANHTSYLDILLLSTFLDDRFTVAANAQILKSWWLKPFLLFTDRYPIDSNSPMATRAIIQKVKQGAKCVIFPEGRLTTTGALMKIYEGPGLIAEKAGAKILPIRIEGAQQAFPFSRLSDKTKRYLFPKITLTVLTPVTLKPEQWDKSSRIRRRQYSIQLYRLMREMMFAANNYQTMLYQSLILAKETFGGNCLIAEDMERQAITYRQFILKTVILGRHIKQSSHFSERIGIMLPTTITAMINFFALQGIGRIPAMINFTSGSRNIISACQKSGIKQIYTSLRFVQTMKLHALVSLIKKNAIEVHYLESLRDEITVFKKLAGLFTYLNIKRIHHRIAHKMRPSDPAVILFTSGSEGSPKAVVLSHENLLANCQQMRAIVDFSQKDTVFNTLPVFHCFGLTVGSILPLISGIKVFFYPSPLHYRVVPELIYDCNATLLFGTDTFLSGYARYAHNYDFYSIRYVFAGAERLKADTYRIWTEKFGVRVFEGYGTTETAPVLACNTPMENKLGTVGRFMPGIEYRLEAVEGLTKGGRLFVKGPNIMLGYLIKENTLDQPKAGWYDTGDIVQIDAEGFVTICDRAKRFAKIAGEMVSLSAIEKAVNDISPEAIHACISIEDEKKGEQIILFSTDPELAQNQLRQSMQTAGFSEIYIPKQLKYVKEIPLLASGKVDYPGIKSLL